MSDNVTNILDPVPTSSPLTVIVRRRHWIAARRTELRERIAEFTTELNTLYNEDNELKNAENAVRKLLDTGHG
jgi:hypothetical protein